MRKETLTTIIETANDSSVQLFVKLTERVIPNNYDGTRVLQRGLLGVRRNNTRPVNDINTIRRDAEEGEPIESQLAFLKMD